MSSYADFFYCSSRVKWLGRFERRYVHVVELQTCVGSGLPVFLDGDPESRSCAVGGGEENPRGGLREIKLSVWDLLLNGDGSFPKRKIHD